MSQSHQVIVLAGGAGTRLAPMTTDLPKPLLPIAGKPVLTGLFSLLAHHGFTEAKLAVHYRAEQISAHYGNAWGGLRLSYHREETPLGTAGCVAAAAAGDTRPVLVLSGDGVLEADLSALLAFHESRGAAVTVLLAHRDDPGEYGVVLCEADGRIRSFLEKPGKAQAFADTVNTGVYVLAPQVLELIPADVPFDFARDLFPRLLAKGSPMYGFSTDAFWCDMGDFESYRACNFRAAKTENVMGAHCRVAESAHLYRSILHDGVTVGARTLIEDAILCRGVTVGADVSIGAGAVIGADCVLADRARLAPGVRLERGTHVAAGTQVTAQTGGEPPALRQVDAHGIRLSGGDLHRELSEVAQAVASLADRIGVMASSVESGRAVRLLISELEYFGAQVFVLDADSYAVAAAMARAYRFPLTLHLTQTSESCSIALLDADGLVPDRLFERALLAALARPKRQVRAGARVDVHATGLLYRGMLARGCQPLSGLSLAVTEASHLRAVLTANGAHLTADAPLTFTVTEDGRELVAREGERQLDFWHLVAILLSRMPSGWTVALPHTAPFSLTQVAEGAGLTVKRYATVPFDRSEAQTRQLVGDAPWLCDGSALAVALCSLLVSTGTTLTALAATLPQFVQLHTRYPLSIPSAALLSAFGLPAGDGVIRFPQNGCSVRLLPHASGGFSLYTEAQTSAEAMALNAAAEQELFSALSHKSPQVGEYSMRRDGVR